jgi:hypothetical protein
MLSGYVIVLDTICSDIDYFGIARYNAWPLDSFTDDNSKILSYKVFQIGINSQIPLTLPTTQICLLNSYLEHCIELGLSVKLFYLSTQTGLFPADMHYLGCDYISSIDASYIYDDGQVLFAMFPQKLGEIRQHMTASGLFQSYKDANQYAAIRRQLDCEKLGLEYNCEEIFVETFILSPRLSLAGKLETINPKDFYWLDEEGKKTD